MSRLSLCLGIFIFGFLHGSRAQSTDPLCEGCVMVNGAGYNAHVDCDKFIQCNYNVFGDLVAVVMDCPFGTHWNMNTLTCLTIGETPCDRDTCLNLPDNSEYSTTTNCRGYMKCMAGQSQPMCCESDYIYVDNLGCIADVDNDCNDTCFNVMDPIIVKPTCDKYPVSGKPNMYKQFVAGWGEIEMFCAPGTLFLADSCRCLQFTDQVFQKAECKPEIYLPFTHDHRDQSGKRNYVQNENVEIINGVARFNGRNSRLIIPRFTNLEHSTTVIIKAKYSSKHETFTGMARALVSNADCGTFPSIMLSEDESNVYFGVGTDATNFAYTYIPQLARDPSNTVAEKEIEYRFDNSELTGSNAAFTEAVEAPGYLRNVKCAIQIGYGESSKPGQSTASLLPFEGEIDELSIYLCNPDQP